MRNSFVVGIAGGSGSGKSTLAVSLCRKYPDQFALLHLDDYFKKEEDAPRLHEMTNWEDPEALRFDNLIEDLASLKNGDSITVRTKSELYNPDYDHSVANKIEQLITPKSIIIIEGYLALHNPSVRELMDFAIFLDIDIRESSKRRSPNKSLIDENYFEKLLAPFHRDTVEPTRQYADLVIDVATKNNDEVFSIVEEAILKAASKM